MSLFNGTADVPPAGEPVHTLPDSHKCSFLRVRGWPQSPSDPCTRRWRGPCYDSSYRHFTVVGCSYSASDGETWRLSFEWYHGDRRNKPGQQIPRVASGRSLPFRRSNASTNATVNDASMDGMSMNKSALAPDVVLLGFDLWEEYRVRNASEVCAGQGVWLTHSAPAKATASTLHLPCVCTLSAH